MKIQPNTMSGGPAFPDSKRRVSPTKYDQRGMTLRQWYAGQAIAGHAIGRSLQDHITAQTAFELADAMIAYERDEL